MWGQTEAKGSMIAEKKKSTDEWIKDVQYLYEENEWPKEHNIKWNKLHAKTLMLHDSHYIWIPKYK